MRFLEPGRTGVPKARAGLPIAIAEGDGIVLLEISAHDFGGIFQVFAVGVSAANGGVEAGGVLPSGLGDLERAEGAATVTVDYADSAGGLDMVDGGNEVFKGLGLFGGSLDVSAEGLPGSKSLGNGWLAGVVSRLVRR